MKTDGAQTEVLCTASTGSPIYNALRHIGPIKYM